MSYPPHICRPVPSSETKHLALLKYPLWPPIEGCSISDGIQRVAHLNQNDDCRTSTGSTLWLSSQVSLLDQKTNLDLHPPTTRTRYVCSSPHPKTYAVCSRHRFVKILSAYLLATLSKNMARAKSRSLRAVEVGAGTGLLSITLSALSYTVLATDIEPSLSQILLPNVRDWMEDNPSAGKICTCQLDWNLEPDCQSICTAFSSDANLELTSDLNLPTESNEQVRISVRQDGLPTTSIDLIVSADTVYTVELIRPLLTTLTKLTTMSLKQPLIYIALERRDPNLVDNFFRIAVEMGFRATQVEHNRLRKWVDSMGWIDGDWEAVEVWKLCMKQRRA
ncbi:hypothetical protein MJO28_007563 [Puccinia striiformis f. sp. tritici]|uniref:Uncharacterized protein n=1 Tax=Puccinia striiformis f. sp. tritici TaxID=168172 RepID=A0ACC0EET3_9BASI|nr:hypothetical protein MJO28_007563 [Puccinia striiformis f. sp. tritici]